LNFLDLGFVNFNKIFTENIYTFTGISFIIKYSVFILYNVYKGAAEMEKQDKIAAGIFQKHGLRFDNAKRAGGWTNTVWLNDNLVLRLSNETGTDRIRREIEKCKMLPLSVGYPVNVAAGVIDGYEWSLSERIQGNVLRDVWDDLNLTEKVAAVKQVFEIMNDVHSVDVCKVEHLTLRRAWYNSFNKDESFADIERYITQNVFTAGQGNILYKILERFYKWHSSVTPVFNHGDITMDNLLWHSGNVVSLLDFEHSVIAPPQLDLHSMFNEFMSDKKSERKYIAEIKELFKPLLSYEYESDLLLGYSFLFYQRFFEGWLKEPKGEIEQCGAYQKLLSLSDGFTRNHF